jgi:hypothetical protein
VYELAILRVSNVDPPRDWRVVVGLDAEYEATASGDCTDWEWIMPDGVPDMWHPEPSKAASWSQSGTMFLHNSDLPVASDWDHMGDSYGNIYVTCADGDGNSHSSEYSLLEVFFEEDPMHNPDGTSPNWFYYWKPALYPGVQNVTYSSSTMYGSTAGAYPYAIEIGDKGNVHYQTPYNHTALCGYPRPTADGKNRIDLFYSVLTHELQHRADLPHAGEVPDTDGDLLPDVLDPFPAAINGAGYQEYGGANAWMGDWEYRARAVEDVTAPKVRDWSLRGKMWIAP